MRVIAIYLLAIAALAFTEKDNFTEEDDLAEKVNLAEKDKLTGRWQTKVSEKGNITSAVFKEDKTFEGFVNKKPFVSGKYEIKDELFVFTDNGCNGAEGKYKLLFFSNDDSVRFKTLSDDCVERSQGMERLILGRVK